MPLRAAHRWLARAVLGLAVLASALLPAASLRADERPLFLGTVQTGTFFAPTLGESVPYRVYLPPDYLDSQRAYPVLYMLHGAGGDYTEWTDSSLPEQADAMIQRGEIAPMIIVMPDGGGRTYWANWSFGGPQWTDYLVNDVVSFVEQRYRTIATAEARAIGGHSMGGFGALHVAMRFPDVFGVVGAHSPSIRTEPDPELWYLDGDNFWEHNPIWLAQNRPGLDRLRIWIDIGDEDWWRPNTEILHETLDAAQIPHEWSVLPGTHGAEYWIANVPRYLRFYDTAFKAGRPASRP